MKQSFRELLSDKHLRWLLTKESGSTGTKTLIEVHEEHNTTGISRGAAIALLFSTVIHLGILLGIAPHHGQLGDSVSVLEVSLIASEREPVKPDGISDQGLRGQSPAPSAYDIERGLSTVELFQPPHPFKSPTGSGNTRYFVNAEVDIPAEPISRPSIIYPEQALLSKLAGKVRVRILIDLAGYVKSIEILDSQPPYPPFEDIAVNAIKETRFSPAKRFGQAVNSQKDVEVIFNPYQDSAAAP